MEAILKFNLPEETSEFETAVKAGAMAGAIHEIGQNVFRPARKHGYPNQKIQDLITHLDKLANQAAGISEESYESADGATELVSMLEQMFYDILNEYEANPN